MPRPSNTDKFFYQVPRKTGSRKGQIFFGIHSVQRRGGPETTMQDLIDFMKEKGIDPAKVSLEHHSLLFWAKT